MSFEEYRGKRRPRKSGCAVCGKPSEGRVVVTLQARYTHPERTSKDANKNQYPSIDSISRSYCEAHAVEVYEAAKSQIADRDA